MTFERTFGTPAAVFLLLVLTACGSPSAPSGGNHQPSGGELFYLQGEPEGNEISLEWIDSASDDSGYIIERAPLAGEFVQIGEVLASETRFSDVIAEGTVV